MKKQLLSYQTLFFVLAFLLLMPKTFTDKVRDYGAHSGALFYQHLKPGKASKEEIEELRLENSLLSRQIQEVKQYLVAEETIEERFKELETIHTEAKESSEDKEFFIRKEKKLLARLQKYTKSVHAKIIYREPALWNEQCWIDVGKKDNQELGYDVIVHNSPVVIGNSLVGIVDYVGETLSRIRLITDPGVCVAVRALRGGAQNEQVLEHLSKLLRHLKHRDDLFFSQEEQTNVLGILAHLQENFQIASAAHPLAKGEVMGLNKPVWRRESRLLRGVGFNYDHADEEGPAKDLRLQEVCDEALVQEGDLLITTGMDGIFPEGLHVGVIEKVLPLEEGGIAYSVEASHFLPHREEMRYVSILPPMHVEPFTTASSFSP